MKLTKIQIYNYKGFADSGPLTLSPHFTVVVGKNNSGKSALLQSLRFCAAGSKPHRSPMVDRDVQLDPTSRLEGRVILEWPEIENIASKYVGGQIAYPVNQAETDTIPDLHGNWREFLSTKCTDIRFAWHFNNPEAQATCSPSHAQFVDPGLTMLLNLQPSTATWNFGGLAGNAENLVKIASQGLLKQIYVFDAERLSIDASQPAPGQILAPNASNLPTLLDEMMTNPDLWEKFNRHVSEIFPSITRITVPPADGGGNKTIAVWQVDPTTQREDLAVRLRECGTGIGQVLAILHVAMTRKGNVIAIDEPNSFLHPGASRKLIEILKTYSSNQYIIATHSADLIAAIRPEIIHQVSWDTTEGCSRVRQIDASNLDEMADLLDDLGVRLSDTFGADQIVWVEGQTEEICFPLIARLADPPPPPGTVFAHVRSTGDFDAKAADAKQVWGIYKRLSSGKALLAPAIAFSFDREGRSEQYMTDLAKESSGTASFLPRRMFENHLLHPAAIAFAIAGEFKVRSIEEAPPSPETVHSIVHDQWKAETGGDGAADWSADQGWIADCHAAKVLAAAFERFKLSYSMVRHGEQIVLWLIDNEPEQLREVADYLGSLWVP
jgi:predicted ATPase